MTEQTTRFTDRRGRAWSVDVDIVSVRAIRQQLGVDLTDLLNGRADALQQLVDDPEKMVDALYLICQEQCELQGVTPEQFGRALAGETIDAAVDAFMVGLAYFFRKGQREVVLAMIQKIRQTQDRLTAKALEALESDRVTQAIERQADEALERFYRDLETADTRAETTRITGGGSSPS